MKWQHKGHSTDNLQDILELRKELIQTAAMCIRALMDTPCLQVSIKPVEVEDVT